MVVIFNSFYEVLLIYVFFKIYSFFELKNFDFKNIFLNKRNEIGFYNCKNFFLYFFIFSYLFFRCQKCLQCFEKYFLRWRGKECYFFVFFFCRYFLQNQDLCVLVYFVQQLLYMRGFIGFGEISNWVFCFVVIIYIFVFDKGGKDQIFERAVGLDLFC